MDNRTINSRISSAKSALLLVIGIFAVALLVRISALIISGGPLVDDAYITLRVARNLATGLGFEYNIGCHLQSCSSPLWALVAAGLWCLFGAATIKILPVIGAIGDALAAAGITALVLGPAAFEKNNLSQSSQHFERSFLVEALFAGLFYSCLSTNVLVSIMGLETGFYTMIIVYAFLTASLGYYNTSALLAGLAILLRPDGVLLSVFVISIIFFNNKRFPLIPTLIILAVVGPYIIFALNYYHSVIPQTIVAKGLLSRSPIKEWYFFLNKFFLSGPSAWLMLIMFTIGSYFIFFNRRDLLPTLIWTIAYISGYSTVAMWWSWYLPPAMIGYTLAIGLGIGLTLNYLMKNRHYRKEIISAIALCLIGILLGQNGKYIKYVSVNDVMDSQIFELSNWIESNTQTSAKVMVEPLGYLGFLCQRNFHDYPGLVSQRVTAALREMKRPIPPKPWDPEIMDQLIERIHPTILILRQDEYEAIFHIKSLKGYTLEKHQFQQPYFMVLARNGDPLFGKKPTDK